MQTLLDIPGLLFLERGWLSANNILFTDSESATLLDSGYVAHQEQTLTLVRGALQSRPLDRLVNTHLHSDHCGGNAILQAHYPHLRTLIPPGESMAVGQWDTEALSYEATGQLCPRFTFDAILQPGTQLRLANLEWQVHAAPGHDPHSVILFEPQHKILISADALWANGFGVVFPELEGISAFDEVGRTLDIIEKLKPDWIIPGHGAIFKDASTALTMARQKLDAFVTLPDKHAKYAAKVLLKFKLLELRKVNLQDFVTWAIEVRYLKLLQQRYASDVSIADWVMDMLRDLERSNALRFQESMILNI